MKRELGKPLVSGTLYHDFSGVFWDGPGKRMNHSEGLAFLIGGAASGSNPVPVVRNSWRAASSLCRSPLVSAPSQSLSLLASKLCLANAPHQIALPFGKRPGVSYASLWIPLGPRAQHRSPQPSQSSPARPQCSVPCICPSCILHRPPAPVPWASQGLPVVLLWAPHCLIAYALHAS